MPRIISKSTLENNALLYLRVACAIEKSTRDIPSLVTPAESESIRSFARLMAGKNGQHPINDKNIFSDLEALVRPTQAGFWQPIENVRRIFKGKDKTIILDGQEVSQSEIDSYWSLLVEPVLPNEKATIYFNRLNKAAQRKLGEGFTSKSAARHFFEKHFKILFTEGFLTSANAKKILFSTNTESWKFLESALDWLIQQRFVDKNAILLWYKEFYKNGADNPSIWKTMLFHWPIQGQLIGTICSKPVSVLMKAFAKPEDRAWMKKNCPPELRNRFLKEATYHHHDNSKDSELHLLPHYWTYIVEMGLYSKGSFIDAVKSSQDGASAYVFQRIIDLNFDFFLKEFDGDLGVLLKVLGEYTKKNSKSFNVSFVLRHFDYFKKYPDQIDFFKNDSTDFFHEHQLSYPKEYFTWLDRHLDWLIDHDIFHAHDLSNSIQYFLVERDLDFYIQKERRKYFVEFFSKNIRKLVARGLIDPKTVDANFGYLNNTRQHLTRAMHRHLESQPFYTDNIFYGFVNRARYPKQNENRHINASELLSVLKRDQVYLVQHGFVQRFFENSILFVRFSPLTTRRLKSVILSDDFLSSPGLFEFVADFSCGTTLDDSLNKIFEKQLESPLCQTREGIQQCILDYQAMRAGSHIYFGYEADKDENLFELGLNKDTRHHFLLGLLTSITGHYSGFPELNWLFFQLGEKTDFLTTTDGWKKLMSWFCNHQITETFVELLLSIYGDEDDTSLNGDQASIAYVKQYLNEKFKGQLDKAHAHEVVIELGQVLESYLYGRNELSRIVESAPQFHAAKAKGKINKFALAGYLSVKELSVECKKLFLHLGDSENWLYGYINWQNLDRLLNIPKADAQESFSIAHDFLSQLSLSERNPKANQLADLIENLNILNLRDLEKLYYMDVFSLGMPNPSLRRKLFEICKKFEFSRDDLDFLYQYDSAQYSGFYYQSEYGAQKNYDELEVQFIEYKSLKSQGLYREALKIKKMALKKFKHDFTGFEYLGSRQGFPKISNDFLKTITALELNNDPQFRQFSAQIRFHPYFMCFLGALEVLEYPKEWNSLVAGFEAVQKSDLSEEDKNHQKKEIQQAFAKSMQQVLDQNWIALLNRALFKLIEASLEKSLEKYAGTSDLTGFLNSPIYQKLKKRHRFYPLIVRSSRFMNDLGLKSLVKLVVNLKEESVKKISLSWRDEVGENVKITRLNRLTYANRDSDLAGILSPQMHERWKADFDVDQMGKSRASSSADVKSAVLKQSYQQIMTHFQPTKELADKEQALPATAGDKKYEQYGYLIKSLEEWLYKASQFDPEKNEALVLEAKDILSQFEYNFWFIREAFGNVFSEIRTDLRIFIKNSEAGIRVAKHSENFLVTGDIELIARSGSEPEYTCQNMEYAWVNQEGQPVHRLLHGQFKVVNWQIDGATVARRLIEVTIDKKGVPHLLVERLYVGAGFSKIESFKDEIIRYAKDYLGIKADCVHFNDDETIKTAPAPLWTGDTIYRDSFKNSEGAMHYTEARALVASLEKRKTLLSFPRRNSPSPEAGISLAGNLRAQNGHGNNRYDIATSSSHVNGGDEVSKGMRVIEGKTFLTDSAPSKTQLALQRSSLRKDTVARRLSPSRQHSRFFKNAHTNGPRLSQFSKAGRIVR